MINRVSICQVGATFSATVCFVTLLIVSIGCDKGADKDHVAEPTKSTVEPATESTHRAQKKVRAIEIQRELVMRHDAVADWQSSLYKTGDFVELFSLEVQDALLRLDGKPVVFVSWFIEDIYRDEGYKIVCSCEPPIQQSDSISKIANAPSVQFILSTDERTARHVLEILNQHPDVLFKCFAFVAAPTELKVGRWRGQRAVGEHVDPAEHSFPFTADAEIEESGGRTFIIAARCVDWAYLDGFEP